jgi:hypothetical protein
MLMYTLSFSQPATISLGEPMLAVGVEVTLSTSIFAASPGWSVVSQVGTYRDQSVARGRIRSVPGSSRRFSCEEGAREYWDTENVAKQGASQIPAQSPHKTTHDFEMIGL